MKKVICIDAGKSVFLKLGEVYEVKEEEFFPEVYTIASGELYEQSFKKIRFEDVIE